MDIILKQLFLLFVFAQAPYLFGNNNLSNYNGAFSKVYANTTDTLAPLYSVTKCGLGYTSGSVVLGKKMEVYGLPYYGIDQPASITISGIPANSKIEKAYLWWDLTGNDSTGNVIIKNPNLIIDTIAGSLTGRGFRCWGPSAAFRADITSIITGNGNYMISGLPTDTTFTKSDVNGATVFIIYSDSFANFAGTLNIHDGYSLVSTDTIFHSINGLSVNTNVSGKAFMLISDFQNQPGNALKMNNGPFLGVVQDFWDFEEKSSVFVSSQTSSVFGVAAPNDCCNLMAVGVYYKNTYSHTAPIISNNNDTIISTLANTYQWLLNNQPIPGATNQSIILSKSGVYSVVVSYSNSVCYLLSNTLSITSCADQIKPNIEYLNDSLWTDSVNYQLQWYRNAVAVNGATDTSYKALTSGYYWVRASDSTGCAGNSDTVYIFINGQENIQSEFPAISIIPNPNTGHFFLDLNYLTGKSFEVEITNINGEFVFKEYLETYNEKTKEVDLSSKTKGVYFLKITESGSVSIAKLVLY